MSLPLYVEPSPQMPTPCSLIARTSSVPVTARPSGVVLKYVRPAVRMWNAPHCSAASPSRASASLQSTRYASSAPYCFALPGIDPTSSSSYCPRSAVNAYGIAPFSRIHASAQQVSSPPENAMPTRSPTGSEPRMTPLIRLRRAYAACSRGERAFERVAELLLELRAAQAVARRDEDRVL